MKKTEVRRQSHSHGMAIGKDKFDSSIVLGYNNTGVEYTITDDERIIELVNKIVQTGLARKASGFRVSQLGRTQFPGALSGVSYFTQSGILLDEVTFPRRLFHSVVSRLKLMAHLMISMKNSLQIGVCLYELCPGVTVKVHVIAVPTIDGDELIVRLG